MSYGGQRPFEGAVFNVLAAGRELKLSENLTLGEVASKDGTPIVLIHPAVVGLFQDLRDRFGPLRVTSGYRTVAHNAAVGGVRNSFHTFGMALDLQPLRAGVTLNQIASAARSLGAWSKVYPTFLHVDVR